MQRIALILIFLAAVCMATFGQSSRACPVLKFTEPTSVLAPDEPTDFRVVVSGIELPEKLSYTWGTSLGKIVSGDQTSNIRLVVPQDSGGRNFTVFVRVVGLPEGCPDILSDTFGVLSLIVDEFPPTFGSVRNAIAYANVDSWIIRFHLNPGYKGIAVMRFSEKEPDQSRLRRLRQILQALRLRRQMDNVLFAIVEPPSRTETELYIRRAASDLKLEGESYVIIRAAELEKNPRRILGTKVCSCYRKIT